jgi:hypothetical protein
VSRIAKTHLRRKNGMTSPEMAFNKIQQAVQFFKQRLATGPQPARGLYQELLNLGISRLLAERARRRLGILSYQRDGIGWMSVDTTKDKCYRFQKGSDQRKAARG